ncbi:uncharacterized protein LOC122933321 isoform X2 [Bufo gargarizans]|uniref:uncharacterized protein LOC122933321 isoform X2 n=1 Tax=Bufo gargarizans TaxID=30331 RepID=UPI001CF17283|nr:uncharacterized protein LOC122933321 isoform X2 [Bufo gargarizans]
MENAFLELYEEVRKLQIICSKQADLLQELLSKKDHVTEMPVSKPIQCTDTGDDVCSESPFFRLKGKEDQCVEAIKTQADDVPVPLETEENPSLLLDIDVRFPPCEDQYNFLASVPDKEETAVGLPCAEFTSDEVNSNYALFIKNDTPKFLNMDNNGSKIAPAGVYLDFLTPVNIEHNFSLSNIYQEDIRFLQSTDISFEALLEPHKNFNEVKGPAQVVQLDVCT